MWFISYRCSMMDLNFHGVSFFFSSLKKCLFSGGHLFWLPVATMIQSKCSFECDALRTAPVLLTIIFFDINWVLGFHSRWRFFAWKVAIFLLSSMQGCLMVFSSDCDAFRTAPVWWTLIFMALADFSSVKKKYSSFFHNELLPFGRCCFFSHHARLRSVFLRM